MACSEKMKKLEKKAKTGNLGDGPSSLPSGTSFRRMADGGTGGTVESGGGEELEGLQDPLVVFGSGIMTMILSKLDARSVALACLVCREWREVASADKIWAAKEKKDSCGFTEQMEHVMISQVCKELWLGKAHIPRICKVEGLSKMAAASLSIIDGKRTRITRNDLCDHIWEFHFSEAAPDYWRNLDPYWVGSGPPMRRYFHPDGSVTADPDDKVWGGHESTYTIVTGLYTTDGSIREHYVRINRWPQLSMERKPDWIWVLSNHLCCYTSIPDAHEQEGTGPSSPSSYS